MTTGTWYYAAGEAQKGPFTADEIRGLLRDRVVDRETYVWSPAMADWAPLGQTELVALIGAPPPPPPQAAHVPSLATRAPAARPLGKIGGFDLGAMEQGEGFPGVMLRAARIAIQQKYIDFQGRASRPEYWWYQLFGFLLLVAAWIIDVVIAAVIGFSLLYFLVALALFLPNLGAAVRRLHDTNRSGWWLLLSLIPLVGAIVIIVFLCLPGDQGDNRFGAPRPPV